MCESNVYKLTRIEVVFLERLRPADKVSIQMNGLGSLYSAIVDARRGECEGSGKISVPYSRTTISQVLKDTFGEKFSQAFDSFSGRYTKAARY